MDFENMKAAFQAGYVKFFTKLNQDREFKKRFDNTTLGCQLVIFEKFIDKEYNKLKERDE